MSQCHDKYEPPKDFKHAEDPPEPLTQCHDDYEPNGAARRPHQRKKG